MMTPAAVAEQLATYIAKQEKTLQRYPVGPLANTAKMNLMKGKKALAALQDKNEQMRVSQEPAASMQMEPGGPTFELGLRNLNPGNIRSWGNKPVKDGFAQFKTLDEGWEALKKQLERYQGKLSKPSGTGVTGESTLSEAMAKYAPHFENDTAGYIDRLVDYLGRGGVEGISADTKISDIPTDKWASAIALVESPQGYAALESAGLLNDDVAQALANDTAVVNNREVVPQYLETNPTAFRAQPIVQPDDPTTSLQDTPDFMLSPQAQADRAAVLGQDAAAVPEAAATPPVAQADPERAGQFSALGDLDFNGAQSTAGTADVIGNVNFARNEYGDYNVIHPERGKFVVRQGDWNPNDIETTLNSGIPYDDAVDGPATNSDRLQTLVSPLTDPTRFNMQLSEESRGISERLGVANSGMGMSFRDVANVVAEQRGIKPVKTNTRRMMGDMGKSYTTTLPDPKDQARYDREMDEIYAEIAASPGTYKFQNEVTLPLVNPTEEDIAQLEAEGYKINTGALGVQTATKLEEHVGVGGYSPMSDYVAYATNDPDYQNRFQNRQQTRGLIGNLIAPGNIAGPVRAAAVSRGTAALGKGLGDDAVRAIQAGDDAALQVAVGQEVKALGQGQKMLPQGSAGPAVKGVPGMQFKPGTGAQGQPVTYTPASNAAGRTIDITPVATTQRGALTARQQIQQSGVNVLDEGAGGVLGVQRGQFRFPAGSAGGQGGRFGGVQPGGLSMPGSRLPAVRNVGLQTTRQSSTALGPVNPMTGLPAQSALQRGTIGLADDAMGSIPTIERASGIGGNIFTRTPFALERLGVAGAETYFPRFDERIFPEGQEAGQTPVPPVVDSDGDDVPDIIDGDGGEGTAGEGTPPNKRDETPVDNTELGGPDTYNIDMGNAAALMGVPALASLASAGIQRRALNQMQAPTAPVLNQIPNFDYRSNVGQQLIDAREASRAAGQNTNLQGAQQAALAQSLNVQRMQQETRIRQGDEAMRQQALDRYNTGATQMRQMNNAMINQYNQDRTNFDNAMTQAQAAVSQQPLNVVSGVAQDYLKNIYQTNMANTLEGIGRQFNTGNIAGQNLGMQQGNLVPVTNSQGAIIGYQQAPQ